MTMLYIQQYGRALRGRPVHAKRARKLRRRGETVRHAGFTNTGKAIYRWLKQPAYIDHKAGLGRAAVKGGVAC